jgi:hypothetical protein
LTLGIGRGIAPGIATRWPPQKIGGILRSLGIAEWNPTLSAILFAHSRHAAPMSRFRVCRLFFVSKSSDLRPNVDRGLARHLTVIRLANSASYASLSRSLFVRVFYKYYFQSELYSHGA